MPFQEHTLVQAYTLNMADDNVVGPFSIGFDFKFLEIPITNFILDRMAGSVFHQIKQLVFHQNRFHQMTMYL